MPATAKRRRREILVCSTFLSPQILLQEKLFDAGSDLLAVRLECEMAGLQHMGFYIFQITPVRRGAFRREDEVVFAPHDQGWWLILPEEGLELRVEGHIVPVGMNQVHLDVAISRTIEAGLIDQPGCRVEQRSVRHAVFVLPSSRLWIHKEVQRGSVLGSRICPIFLDGIPKLTEALIVRIAVLHAQPLNPSRMPPSTSSPDWGP